ncbi:hypothetical protein [Candidatus Uabimicrobium sp. HlEnr_7]|uniref:hypothetical protein n=1 Tax=Candidatus Uabimicrobium helgolandensis TaxID=3095367 RepID=UPI0035565B0E
MLKTNKKIQQIISGCIVVFSLIVLVYISYLYNVIPDNIPQIDASLEEKPLRAQVEEVYQEHIRNFHPYGYFSQRYSSWTYYTIKWSETLNAAVTELNQDMVYDYDGARTTLKLLIFSLSLIFLGAILVLMNRSFWLGAIIIFVSPLFTFPPVSISLMEIKGSIYGTYWTVPHCFLIFVAMIVRISRASTRRKLQKQKDVDIPKRSEFRFDRPVTTTPQIHHLEEEARFAYISLGVLIALTFFGIPIAIWIWTRISKMRVEFTEDRLIVAGALVTQEYKFDEIRDIAIFQIPVAAKGIGGYLARKKVGGRRMAMNLCIKKQNKKIGAFIASSYQNELEIMSGLEEAVQKRCDIIGENSCLLWQTRD